MRRVAHRVRAKCFPFRGGALYRDLAHLVVDAVDVAAPLDPIANGEFFDTFGVPNRFKEGAPVIAGIGQHCHPTILGTHRTAFLNPLVRVAQSAARMVPT